MLPCEVRVCSLDRGEALLAMNFGADSLEQRFVCSVCWYMRLEWWSRGWGNALAQDAIGFAGGMISFFLCSCAGVQMIHYSFEVLGGPV